MCESRLHALVPCRFWDGPIQYQTTFPNWGCLEGFLLNVLKLSDCVLPLEVPTPAGGLPQLNRRTVLDFVVNVAQRFGLDGAAKHLEKIVLHAFVLGLAPGL